MLRILLRGRWLLPTGASWCRFAQEPFRVGVFTPLAQGATDDSVSDLNGSENRSLSSSMRSSYIDQAVVATGSPNGGIFIGGNERLSRKSRERAYRDPVHDFITLTDPLFVALIDTPEFQRLRRIRQLGATHGTYHGAEHSRFGHSLGVLWIMHKVLRRLRNLGLTIDEETETVAYAAALLHDVGHGPYSHALETRITPGVDHEAWTLRILEGDTNIRRILASYDSSLPAKVASVIEGSWTGPKFVRSLVTSQLDVDRMDYLIRDSLYTGVTYGRYDLERLINTLWVVNEELVLMTKGIVAAEEYILARYFMYWQVYFHKTTRGHEHLMRQIWQRATDLAADGSLPGGNSPAPLHKFLVGGGDVATFLAIDDYDVMYAIKQWIDHPDEILRDLCRRFLHRDLLKPVFREAHESLPLERSEDAAEIVRRAGWDPTYYLVIDRTSDVAYDYYTTPDAGGVRRKPILALNEAGIPQEIATLSHTIAALATRRRVAVNLYVPSDCAAAVRDLFDA